jgi:hypothetical protein
VADLVGRRARLLELRRRGHWPARVPAVLAVVLAEALTGDHRRDHHANRLLRSCQVRDVTERHARAGARLRTATGRAGTISAVDAMVVALAGACTDPVVLTSDPADLGALAAHSVRPVVIAAV